MNLRGISNLLSDAHKCMIGIESCRKAEGVEVRIGTRVVPEPLGNHLIAIRKHAAVGYAIELQILHDRLINTAGASVLMEFDGMKDPIAIVDKLWRRASEND
jgi:hypothetical protein